MGRRCCCEECIIFEDLFNRSDSSTLGASWANIGGSWTISSNECVETTGNGIVRTVRSHPHGAMSSYFTLSLTNIHYGEKRRLLFHYFDDENYNYVEHYYYNDGGIGKTDLSLGTVISGIDTVLVTNTKANDDIEGYDTNLRVCINQNGIYFGSGTGEGVDYEEYYCDIEDPGGRKAGLANVSGEGISVQFDNFHWEQHELTLAGCPTCACNCDGYCVGDLTLTIVVTNPEDCDCTILNNLEVDGTGSPLGEGQWQFNFPWQTFPWIGLGASCGNMKTDQSFKLFCPGYGPTVPTIESDCEGFFLCDWSGGQLYGIPGWTTSYCTGESPDGAFPTECTCSPFWLKYGPFEIWEQCEDPDCPHLICTFEIHITKKAVA